MLAYRTCSILRASALKNASPLVATQARLITTVTATDKDEQEILKAQRKNRPISPHIDIYKKQLTFMMSGAHRITGVLLAGGFYALTCTYAASDILGWDFNSASLVSLIAGLPFAVKFGAKALFSYPFTYHAFNGVRHLIWDTARELTIKGVYKTGYTVLGLTALVGTGLLFL